MGYNENIIEPIDKEFIKFVLDVNKYQSSQTIIVPRFIASQPILGLNERTIVAESHFEAFENQQLIGKPLWASPDLHYIEYMSKDVAPFLRMINQVKNLYIQYYIYIVNGTKIALASSIFSDELVIINIGTETITLKPILPLIPYIDDINLTNNIIHKWRRSKLVKGTESGIDISENIDFSDMYNGLASLGAKPISASKDLVQYVMYLAKTMFTFTKKDQIRLYIADDIPDEDLSMFMAMVEIRRVKKKMNSVHRYYFMGKKLI